MAGEKTTPKGPPEEDEKVDKYLRTLPFVRINPKCECKHYIYTHDTGGRGKCAEEGCKCMEFQDSGGHQYKVAVPKENWREEWEE